MNKMLYILPVAFAVLAPLPSLAQFGPSKVATAHAFVRSAAAARGGKGVLTVTLAVKPQYHVNANHPNDPGVYPDCVHAEAGSGHCVRRGALSGPEAGQSVLLAQAALGLHRAGHNDGSVHGDASRPSWRNSFDRLGFVSGLRRQILLSPGHSKRAGGCDGEMTCRLHSLYFSFRKDPKK